MHEFELEAHRKPATRTLDGAGVVSLLDAARCQIRDWHRGRDHWDWADQEPSEYHASVDYWLRKLLYHNFQIWHYEDPCRSGDQTVIAACKPRIDRHNRLRHHAIEALDELFSSRQANPAAPANSETLASILDRSTINSLKLYHVAELAPVDLQRFNTLCDQGTFLALAAAKLLDNMIAGTAASVPFRQLKMYNDRETNKHVR